jgi:hypothetical protein
MRAHEGSRRSRPNPAVPFDKRLLDLWGSDCAWSKAITGASAELLGIPGYDTKKGARSNYAIQIAREMLEEIERSEPLPYILYSGHAMARARVAELVVGNTIRLPLTAGSPDIDIARAYTSQPVPGAAVLLRFEHGTKGFEYSRSEVITVGDFIVERVRKVKDPYWKTTLRVVTLAPATTAPNPVLTGVLSGWEPRVIVGAGSELLHGTGVEEDFEVPDGPAWFTDDEATAAMYSKWSEVERPRVLRYRVIEPVTLPLIVGNDEEDRFAAATGIDPRVDYVEFAREACRLGIAGWWSEHPGKKHGADVMLCRPEQHLQLLGLRLVDELGAAPRRRFFP